MSGRENVTVTTPSAGAEPAKPAGEEPKLFAGKYKTIEEFEKGHKELESKLGAPKPAGEPAAAVTKPAEAPASLAISPSAEPALPKSFDLNAAEAEFAKDGKLSDKTLKALNGAGISNEQAHAYIEGQKALAGQRVTAVAERVGGVENLKTMQEWAGAGGLSKEALAAFNAQASSKDLETVLLAYDGLSARYAAANGSSPNLLGGEGAAPTGSDVYHSMAEMTEVIGNPKYDTDPAFRAKHEAKVARTDFNKLR